MNTPIERMKKILALARRGEGGEKTTAEAMLQRLLDKYGMTIADLDDSEQPVERREFKYTTEIERRLLTQIVASVLQTRNVFAWKHRNKKIRSYELTALQYAEVDVCYTACRVALKKELAKATERLYMAFVQTNDLGVSDPNQEPTGSGLDLDELAAIMALMATMKPTPVHRQLERSA